MPCFSIIFKLKSRKFFRKIRTAFGEINRQHQRFWLFVKSLKKYVQKNIKVTDVCRFLWGVWFYTQLAGAVEYTNASLQRGKTPPTNKCLGYDIKQSDGKDPALKIWRMWSTFSLLPGSLWSRVIASDRVLSMGQKELFNYLNCVQTNDRCLIELLVIHSNTWNHLTACKKLSSGSFKNVVNKMYL